MQLFFALSLSCKTNSQMECFTYSWDVFHVCLKKQKQNRNNVESKCPQNKLTKKEDFFTTGGGSLGLRRSIYTGNQTYTPQVQHWRASSSGQDSAVHLQLKKSRYFDHQSTFSKEKTMIYRKVKEVINAKLERLLLNRGDWFSRLSPTCTAVLWVPPKAHHSALTPWAM